MVLSMPKNTAKYKCDTCCATIEFSLITGTPLEWIPCDKCNPKGIDGKYILQPRHNEMPTNNIDAIEWFNDIYFSNWRETELIYFTNALAGEVGELCNLTKKIYGGGTNNTMTVEELCKSMIDEIADIYIYLVIIAKRLGVGKSQEIFDTIIRKKLGIILTRMKNKKHKHKLKKKNSSTKLGRKHK
jgi:NTP pyrophosphatase (non-canonical NTP hydrolase)